MQSHAHAHARARARARARSHTHTHTQRYEHSPVVRQFSLSSARPIPFELMRTLSRFLAPTFFHLILKHIFIDAIRK